MNCDDPKIKELVQNRHEWVSATKKNGFEKGIAGLLAHQYSQKTHFIFELLQNAEDAAATEVFFDLTHQALLFSHDGIKLFSPQDVESITSIGSSTKDYTKIGKHGIGFKAVFAITHRPRIHSGQMHFEITNVVLPEPITPASPSRFAPHHATLIVLPFDDESIPDHQRFRPVIHCETAQTQIGEALTSLNIRTLLFLKSIRVIRWRIEGSDAIHELKREENITHSDSLVSTVTLKKGANSEEWCVLRRSGQVSDDEQRHSAVVEVAFLLVNGVVTKADGTELVVFFPTEKKTSLGFLINGPFKTTPARDNISECAANTYLIELAAQLAADSLERLASEGLLRTNSFDALPLGESDFPQKSFFRFVYDAVREALKTKRLIPTISGEFVSVRDARLAGTPKLTEVFDPEELGSLFDRKPLYWVHPSISDNFRNYLAGKKVSPYSSEWAQEPLIEGVRVEAAAIAKRMTADFFKAQHERQPAWLLKFYGFLNEHYETFKETPFIRLESGEYVNPGTQEKPNAYLRPGDVLQIDQGIFTLICESLMVEPALKLLREKAKLREPDKVETIIKCLLPKYEKGSQQFDAQQYAKDLAQLTEAYQAEDTTSQARKRLDDALRNCPWVACIQVGNLNGPVVWKKHADPLFERSDGLVQWFEKNTTAKAWFPHSLLTDQRSPDLLRLLDLRSGLVVVEERHPTFWRRSYVRCESGFDERNTLLGLDFCIVHPTPARACLLWQWLLEHPFKLAGSVRTSPNAQFPEHNTKHYDGPSVLGLAVINNAWLPRRSDTQFFKPSELLLTDLPEDFERSGPRAEALSRMLLMKQPVDLAPLAEALGATPEQFQKLQQKLVGRSFDSLLEALNYDDDPDLPDDPVPNPTLRCKRLIDELQNAPSVESVLRERKVQKNLSEETARARAYLRSRYSDCEGRMFCQCCRARMPFQVNDLDYFEAIRCVRGFDKHYFENRLALCPNCAAKYRHARQTSDAELRSLITSHPAADTAPSVEIPVTLGEADCQLRFVGKHWFDLKTLLTEC